MRPPAAHGSGRSRRRRPAAAVLALLACAAVLTACGTSAPGTAVGTATSSATTPPETGTPSQTVSPSETGAPSDPPPTSTAELDVEHPVGTPARVMAVRFAAHGSYDRVVIDLKGKIPGYTVDWADELVQDGSGEPIEVKGGAYLHIVLTPAEAHDTKGKPTWTGDPIQQANLPAVTHVVRTGDFEGRVGVGLVLERRAPFRVKEYTGPDRLVIDVAH
ncbi:AMIN-like domain-containing (lipo)protein [Nonomuraea rhizosphaerae]|uniref:AMIN-like domain-containing (lipo)protein n=1 Tax=Nonomuraea rhizosphaerae TaxID=2665663 RepID=UPI001C5E70C9|nr:hypothetical protein [Nonomuraea rhizosphaerae]